MMNQMGLKKALEIINKYKEVRPGVQVPSILKQKIEEGKDKWEFRRYVLYEKEDEIAIITIRRPQVLGALSSVVMKELDQVFTIAKEDSSVKGLIITGFGPKAFVSGADISELASLPDPETCVSFAQKGQEIFQRLEDLGKPTVAAINGLALGGGLELALACNKRFIAKGAILGQPEVNLGIIPGYGGTQRLPRWIGFNEAWQMLRSGKPISAEYAEKIGLGTLVEPKELLPQAKKYLKEVIQGKIELNKINRSSYKVPETLPEVDIGHLSKKIDEILKKVILEGAKLPLKEAIAKEAEGFGECKKTKDMEIGMKNFMEKGPKVKANFVHK
jgi:enoyl-CoA hydratase/carnithine racemase